MLLKNFRVLVERDSEKKIKIFRTDRRGESVSKNFVDYCDNAGIVRHFSAP